jgi:hypothetical protein
VALVDETLKSREFKIKVEKFHTNRKRSDMNSNQFNLLQTPIQPVISEIRNTTPDWRY